MLQYKSVITMRISEIILTIMSEKCFLRVDSFRVENRGSRSRNLCPKFFYLNYLCFNLVFYCALHNSHADWKDAADGNEKSFVLKRRGGRRWTIQTAYEPVRTTQNGKLGFLCLFLPFSHRVSSFMDFFIVVLVDRNSCTAGGIRIFNVGVPVWILN